MKRAWMAASCLLACVGFLSHGILAQQPSGGLVTVLVQVTDQAGRPVADLQLKDFSVLENGVAQELRTFGKGDSEGAYVIGYRPAQNPKAGYRPIEVRVRLPNVRVNARAGYYPPESK